MGSPDAVNNNQAPKGDSPDILDQPAKKGRIQSIKQTLANFKLTKPSKKQAILIAVVLLAVAAVAGAFAIHKTVGFPAAGDWLRHTGHTIGQGFMSAWHKSVTWLNQGENLKMGLLTIGIPATLVGAGLTVGSIYAVRGAKAAKQKLDAYLAERKERNEAKDGNKDNSPEIKEEDAI